MRIKPYGTRGSYPVCRPSVMRYGGNTTCLALEHDDLRIVIDGGSGVANLGRELVARGEPRPLHLFLTHPHWDHVLGLPFFAPLYTPGYSLQVYGADSDNKSLEDVLSTQHAARHFPVPFSALTAPVTTRRLTPGDAVTLGAVTVRSIQLNHPGLNLGYRFESAAGTFVILTDLAPIDANLLGDGMALRAAENPRRFEQDYTGALVEFVRGADLVYHDTNFTDDEIRGRLHWGHSTPEHALTLLGQLAEPPALVLSHHDPSHTDDFMDALYAHVRSRGRERGIDVLIAREGEGFSL